MKKQEKLNPSLEKGVSGSSFEDFFFKKVNVKATELPINKYGCKLQHLTLFTWRIFILLWQKHKSMQGHVPSKLENKQSNSVWSTREKNLIFSGSLTVSLPLIYVIKPIA